MVMTDPIADMFTRIRNANQMRHEKVILPSSKMKVEIAKVLEAEGFINAYSVSEGVKKELTIELRYGKSNERVITGIKRVSKPGLRVYAKSDELPKVLNGLGLAIISTPKGLMGEKQARKENIGGEVVGYVW
ncbi:30S ribosomal protein S8 [Mycoplasma sp. P36-A1]|uniref:30S ribosomal protein S8 n=1 Tax=Mycoplasma sp. P36-A1 TaxID=3252900 RepID=UPI003C2FC9CF